MKIYPHCIKVSLAILSLLIFLRVPSVHSESDKEILICTDQNYWYPYSYQENNISKGIHVDIVDKALNNLGYKVIFKPLPWKRCIQSAELGKYGGIVSASYKPERAVVLNYPEDASNNIESKWRITQVEYTFIGHKLDSYEFKGDLDSLPRPVRGPLGYAVVDDLRNTGLAVLTASDTKDLVRHLIRTKKGVIVTPRRNAEALVQDPEFSHELKIHKTPMTSKSYYLVFSKKTKSLDRNHMLAIWNEIARLRDDKAFMKQLNEKYSSR